MLILNPGSQSSNGTLTPYARMQAPTELVEVGGVADFAEGPIAKSEGGLDLYPAFQSECQSGL